MAILLGIDTGGTYTDAVLVDDTGDGSGILTKAKALTTKDDLSRGIGEALGGVLDQGHAATDIELVSISTTLATNALVEGQGGRVLLILIGFDEAALERAGLSEALGPDPVAFIAGGHTPSGTRQAPLDRAALATALRDHAEGSDAVAVVAYFGTRDPEDEIAARKIVRETTGLPVTCGHELASSLNGPKRAVTAVLNARLIGMISDLIAATESILHDRGIEAPLMLVRGDGSLVSASFARNRPIETILSGPAASLIGAAHLTGLADAVVSDIGGTTTDIAVLAHGRPALSPDGATVGGHNTMVEAVDMRTHGLGGDSEVAVDDTSLSPRLNLGPRRLIPISLLALQHGDAVHAVLDQQASAAIPGMHDARFVLRGPGKRHGHGLSSADLAVLGTLGSTPVPVHTLAKQRAQMVSLRRLVSRGLAVMSGFTPSDAAHVLGLHEAWDGVAAGKAAALMARKRDAGGRSVTPDAKAFARLTLDTLVSRSSDVLLDAAMAHDELGAGANSQNPLAKRALAGHSGVTRVDIGVAVPLVGLGASAHIYYPQIAARLGTTDAVPDGADVANAIGAVVGNVRLTRKATITQPSEGCFRIHHQTGTEDLASEERARARASELLRVGVQEAAEDAGAAEVRLSESFDERCATVEGKRVLIEATIQVTATGRPRLT